MSEFKKRNADKEPESSDIEKPKAIPYVPPPPPSESNSGLMLNPTANTLGIVLLILLGGFMTYNFTGQRLTMTANESTGPNTYQSELSTIPTTNTPTPSL